MNIDFDTITSSAPDGRPRRSRRLVAGLGAAMLVAAAGGVGFGIGRSVGNDDQVTTPAAPADDGSVSTDPVEDESVANGSDESAPPSTTPATDEPASIEDGSANDVAATTDYDVVSSGDIVASGGAGYPAFGGDSMELVFERSIEPGLTVRAHVGALWDDGLGPYGGFGPGDWQPPAWCYESGPAHVAIAGPDLIDLSSVGWYSEPYKGRAVSWLTMGRVDGRPHRVVFVQTPPDTTMVTATFGDGSVDSTAPRNQVAVLVVPGAPATIEHDEGDFVWFEETPDFMVTFDNGADAVTVDAEGVGTWDDPEFRASCSPPPPPLPDPGEQPADPASASTEISELMAAIYGPDDDLADATEFIDDPTGVAEAREEVRQGGLEESAASAEAIVEEVVFTSPTEAWFRYRIETINGTFGERYGIAVFVDDVWKISRDTICQDLSLAGGSCGDGWQIIRPPGYEYDEPGYLDDVGADYVTE